MNNRNMKLLRSCLLAVFFILKAMPALAVQQHGDPEGLVAHQLGHILFIAGMLTLLVRVYHNKLQGPGWKEFKGFLWLVILWNLVTFSGHWLYDGIELDQFVFKGSQIVSFSIHSFHDFIFYISRLDHLFLVPSFLLLLLALIKWRRTA